MKDGNATWNSFRSVALGLWISDGQLYIFVYILHFTYANQRIFVICGLCVMHFHIV